MNNYLGAQNFEFFPGFFYLSFLLADRLMLSGIGTKPEPVMYAPEGQVVGQQSKEHGQLSCCVLWQMFFLN